MQHVTDICFSGAEITTKTTILVTDDVTSNNNCSEDDITLMLPSMCGIVISILYHNFSNSPVFALPVIPIHSAAQNPSKPLIVDSDIKLRSLLRYFVEKIGYSFRKLLEGISYEVKKRKVTSVGNGVLVDTVDEVNKTSESVDESIGIGKRSPFSAPSPSVDQELLESLLNKNIVRYETKLLNLIHELQGMTKHVSELVVISSLSLSTIHALADGRDHIPSIVHDSSGCGCGSGTGEQDISSSRPAVMEELQYVLESFEDVSNRLGAFFEGCSQSVSKLERDITIVSTKDKMGTSGSGVMGSVGVDSLNIGTNDKKDSLDLQTIINNDGKEDLQLFSSPSQKKAYNQFRKQLKILKNLLIGRNDGKTD